MKSMNIVLLSGLGPSWPQGSAFYDSKMLNQTFLDKDNIFHKGLGRMLKIEDFEIENNGIRLPLFRKRNSIEKNLTTLTLENILDNCDCIYKTIDLEKVWNNEKINEFSNAELIFLSTTFICNLNDLDYAIKWIAKNFSNAYIVIGGQFSNLKYKKIMELYPNVSFILRGDGEISIPSFLKNYQSGKFSEVPNLVWRNKDKIISNEMQLINLDDVEATELNEKSDNIYYESMRGCAFSCKFCSFPSASPKWRYKSARKIADDWIYYKEKFGIKRVKAMDSAFTFPPKRLDELISILIDKNIEWEAYSRSEVITSKEKIELLEKAKCKLLSIGFESLSDNTLKKMNKRITASQNRIANELLNKYAKDMDFRGSFIVGFPGETEEDFKLTHDFLVNEYKKQFHLSVFSLVDETMPIWKDAEKYNLQVDDLNNPDYNWSHCGMNAETARKLHQQTLYDVRWNNEYAVAVEWQLPYDLPLNPFLNFTDNYRIEKLIERLAFVENDFEHEPEKVKQISQSIINELSNFNIFLNECNVKRDTDCKVLKKKNNN